MQLHDFTFFSSFLYFYIILGSIYYNITLVDTRRMLPIDLDSQVIYSCAQTMKNTFGKILINKIFTNWMGAWIKTITSLAEVVNTFAIIKLKTDQSAILVICLIDIIQVSVEELSEPDADILVFCDVNLV